VGADRPLRLSGSLGYTDPKYNHYISNGVDISNTQAFPQAPKITASAGVDATLLQAPWGNVHALIDYAHSDDYYNQVFDKRPASATVSNSAQLSRAESSDLVNATLQAANIALNQGSLEISLWSHNLFDAHRSTGGVNFGPAFGMLSTRFYNVPRTYGVDATYKF